VVFSPYTVKPWQELKGQALKSLPEKSVQKKESRDRASPFQGGHKPVPQRNKPLSSKETWQQQRRVNSSAVKAREPGQKKRAGVREPRSLTKTGTRVLRCKGGGWQKKKKMDEPGGSTITRGTARYIERDPSYQVQQAVGTLARTGRKNGRDVEQNAPLC